MEPEGNMVPKDGGASGENLMVVVNMAKAEWKDDFAVHKMYSCRATELGFSSGFKHYPARYIAIYVNKGAPYVAVVAACVHLREDRPDRVLWKYEDIDDAEAIRRAEEVRAITRRNGRPCLVFLMSQLSSTKFDYDAKGGLMGSRQYFDVSSLKATDAKSLAARLREVPWSLLPKRNG